MNSVILTIHSSDEGCLGVYRTSWKGDTRTENWSYLRHLRRKDLCVRRKLHESFS